MPKNMTYEIPENMRDDLHGTLGVSRLLAIALARDERSATARYRSSRDGGRSDDTSGVMPGRWFSLLWTEHTSPGV